MAFNAKEESTAGTHNGVHRVNRVPAPIKFLEWTGADHLRHTKLIEMREDEDPGKVAREPNQGIQRSGSDYARQEHIY